MDSTTDSGALPVREKEDDELRAVRVKKGVYGDVVWPVKRAPGVAQVLERVAAAFGLPVEALRGHGRRVGVAKQVAAELCSQYADASQREVGRALGYRGNGAVGKQRACLRVRLARDRALQRRVAGLRKALIDD